ncbi:MAG: Cytochrome c oxidase assembly protein cox19 [Alyxoria varia]|nr:MAG: Cytochrome c oxidase assembly protein cox19 [Alyxoria varia]
MSTFGSPGGQQRISKPSPPERGSFPLDHDGECTSSKSAYLKCLRGARGLNAPDCRELSAAYLQCRMDKNLMARDSMKNLGFGTAKTGTKEVRGEEGEGGSGGGDVIQERKGA